MSIAGNVGGSLSWCWNNLGFSSGEMKFLRERKDCRNGSVPMLTMAVTANYDSLDGLKKTRVVETMRRFFATMSGAVASSADADVDKNSESGRHHH